MITACGQINKTQCESIGAYLRVGVFGVIIYHSYSIEYERTTHQKTITDCACHRGNVTAKSPGLRDWQQLGRIFLHSKIKLKNQNYEVFINTALPIYG
jgi:hypothetical protein